MLTHPTNLNQTPPATIVLNSVYLTGWGEVWVGLGILFWINCHC